MKQWIVLLLAASVFAIALVRFLAENPSAGRAARRSRATPQTDQDACGAISHSTFQNLLDPPREMRLSEARRRELEHLVERIQESDEPPSDLEGTLTEGELTHLASALTRDSFPNGIPSTEEDGHEEDR